MNERIRELMIHAVDVVYEDNPLNEELAKMYIPDCFAEKFTELIANECADIALKSGNIANKSEQAKAEANRIYYKIQGHFGVE